jgi:hypothetical protein
MRSLVIRSVILGLALGIAWLWAGRRITLFLDGVITIRKTSLPVNPLRYDGGGFRIGGVMLSFAGTDNLRGDINARCDSSHRMSLCAGARSFPLGLRTNPDASRIADLEFVADPGDEVRFTVSQSLLSWPTTFEFKIMGGRSPWWKRYVYYRLVWKKASGRKLEMLWRYEQQYYSRTGWTAPTMMWNSQTGLLSSTFSE